MIPEVVARVAHHGVYKRLIALDELHLDGLLAVDGVLLRPHREYRRLDVQYLHPQLNLAVVR